MVSVDAKTRITRIQRHISLVQEFGNLLIEQCQELDFIQDKIEFQRNLAANILVHDHSKLSNKKEFLFLSLSHNEIKSLSQEESEEFKEVIKNHSKTNPHHSEFYQDGIGDMDDVHLAEMVCDWKARSSEFGTDLRDFVKNKAEEKYRLNDFPNNYLKIKKMIDLICPPSFK